MEMIPNTDLENQLPLEAAYQKAKANYDIFEDWYKRMSGLRGGVLPKMPLEDPHLARCVMYLGRRYRVIKALPEFRKAVIELEKTLEKTLRPDVPTMVLSDALQMMQVNYLLIKAFVVKAKALIDKAEDHIERSRSVDDHINRALAEALKKEEGEQFFQELDKMTR